MHRLFWKLFLSVWLALLLFTGGVVVIASVYIDETRAGKSSEASGLLAGFEQRIVQAQGVAREGGATALAAWARDIDRSELIPLLVLDPQGRDLLQRDVSARALAALQRRLIAKQKGLPGMRSPILTPDGAEYWLVPDFQGATLARLVSRPHIVALQLLMATLVGGLVSLLLARYLTHPIERLQRAATAYGEGDFSLRVGESFPRRRDEIVDLAKSMDTMAGRIDSLLRAQGTLLRDVSHELRSPLARVQASLGLARKSDGAAMETHLDRIEKEAERLNDLIGNILRFSRLDSGIREAQREPVDLAQLLRGLAADAAIEAEARNCRIELALPDVAGYAGDPVLLESAVENVVRNALRHAPPGSAVGIALRCEGSHGWCIGIEDAGPGIPPDMLERVFHPFVRVDDARSAQAGGVGLGLAIARKAVEAHGGHIAAANRPGGGLCVSLRLPA